jgi:hypothetical protein
MPNLNTRDATDRWKSPLWMYNGYIYSKDDVRSPFVKPPRLSSATGMTPFWWRDNGGYSHPKGKPTEPGTTNPRTTKPLPTSFEHDQAKNDQAWNDIWFRK